MNVALFFGTFNPPHKGHFHVIDLAFKQFDIDEVWIIPSPQNPFKKSDKILSFDIRYKMLELVLKETKKLNVAILDIEKELPKPSYTYKTVNILYKRYPKTHFFLILGEDNVNYFDEWLNYKDILQKVEVIAYQRSEKKITQKNFSFKHIKHPIENISSTQIREKINRGEDYSLDIPWESLRQYITENGLYK